MGPARAGLIPILKNFFKKYLMKKILSLLVLFVHLGLSALFATETSVITVGGGAAGVTPGDVITVTHSGSTPSAITIKVPATILGTTTVTNGNVNIPTLGKGLVVKEGTASAQGTLGTIAFQTGVLDTISNTLVTANTRVIGWNRTTGTAFTINNFQFTNQVGVGIKAIPKVPETNTFSFWIVEGQ
jgi:hypothetical protein